MPQDRNFYQTLIYSREKLSETSEHTYPLLKLFFDHIENKLKLNVIIAPHPKTKLKIGLVCLGIEKL